MTDLKWLDYNPCWLIFYLLILYVALYLPCSDDYPCESIQTLCVILFKTADPCSMIRNMALRLLQVMDKRFFSGSEEGMLRSTYGKSHTTLSHELARLHPELTMPVFLGRCYVQPTYHNYEKRWVIQFSSIRETVFNVTSHLVITISDGFSASSSETETSSSETETWPIETNTTPSETETFKIRDRDRDRDRDLIFFLSNIFLQEKTSIFHYNPINNQRTCVCSVHAQNNYALR